MIDFKKRTLANGLTVLAHEDRSTPIAAVNVLVRVGSRDEDPQQTGLAHLFEHLMFGGSENVPDFDAPLQRAGGENNAFTNTDYTNYYIAIPSANVETALWVESDRLRGLALNQEGLDVQKQVVVEEFAQRYLNEPYGDVWSLLRELCYGAHHPYGWATIGREVAHIEGVDLSTVRAFYDRYYTPQNAILSLAGPRTTDEWFALAERWFGRVGQSSSYNNSALVYPEPPEGRRLVVERDVPASVVYICMPIGGRMEERTTVLDVASDILSEGASSRLVQRLVKEGQLFSAVNAYISGEAGEGLFVLTGRLMPGVTAQEAEAALIAQLEEMASVEVSDYELQKVRNKAAANDRFGQMGSLNRAMNLAYYEFLGSAELINQQVERHHAVGKAQMSAACRALLDGPRYVMHYLTKK